MLKLSNISKDYVVGNTTINALVDINLCFRDSEFVSVLGASGCGKTTLLNIVGGLDKFTTGDLIINKISTKKYKPKDWDAYRNHSIGFVFQSYNLIGHLTILKNVELALTLSGVSGKERKARATAALASVGLEEQVGKKPNQLSGGQMQRVAIARALVNNPTILLADEPTGALDSKTSTQIMDILQSISKDRLIIMVTHNPDIAEQYSTRIVKLSDGEVVDDSNPFYIEDELKIETSTGAVTAETTETAEVAAVIETSTEAMTEKETKALAEEELPDDLENKTEKSAENVEIATDKKEGFEENILSEESSAKKSAEKLLEKKAKKERKAKQQKTSMSYFTALSLSLRNLMTKKGRTIITAIAGSIGILGIALVLSISNGFNLYIQQMERDIMTNQPVSIQQTTIDLEEMQNAMIDSSLTDKDLFPSDGLIRPHKSGGLEEIASYTNNLSPNFINHMKKIDKSLYRSIDVLKNINFHVLTKYDDGSFSPMEISANGSTSGLMSMFTGSGKRVSFNQMVSNKDYVLEHYQLLKGNYPQGDNEVILVLDSYNRVSTDVLGVLGYKNLDTDIKLDFNEILTERNRINVLSNDQNYYKDGDLYSAISTKLTDSEKFEELYQKASLQLNIVGIMRIKPDDTSSMLATGICFQEGVATKILEEAKKSEIFVAQTSRLTNEVLNGKAPTSIFTGEELGLTNMGDLTSMNFSISLGLGISIPGLSEVSAINIYATDLNAKDAIVGHINDWNKEQSLESNRIKYTDAMSFMFGSFEVMLSAITYVLIAFVAISLIVSTVMIGIITYVSVIERTKEIGILRSIGARKKDISRVFNAESVSIGFSSGMLGIFVAWLLLFPINLVLKYLTEIPNLAILNGWHALILLAISMFLTFMSGLIPSRIAAKKDPITALRSE